jgi:hypothetical protein
LLLGSITISYKTDFLGAKNETKIILEIVFLKGPFLLHGDLKQNAVFYLTLYAYLLIIAGIETFIICKLLEKGIISSKKGNDV